MEKKKNGAGSGAAFYATLAVCLLAMGVGSFQLLRRTELRGAAPDPSQTAAVSGLTEENGDAAEALSPTTGQVQGGIAVPRQETASDAGDETASAAAPASVPDSGGDASEKTASGGASASSGKASASGNSAASGKSASAGNGTRSGGAASGGKAASDSAQPASAPAALPETGALTETAALPETGGASEESVVRAVLRPLEGEVVAAFSMDRLAYDETMGDWRTHDGVDIAAAEGTPVLAACAGTVASVSENPLMGNTVVLSHDSGYVTTYASLAETAALEVGDHVAAGMPLGAVGTSAAAEAAQGPHLHFSVRRDGESVDPEDFLHGDAAVTAANVEPLEESD